MAYASGFEHDVFVSYAHADNLAAGGGETGQGWVTALRHNLIHAPGALQKDVYIDYQPGAPFDADLRRKVERSALLLIVLSQNYIESEWCGKELEHFVETHGDDRSRPRDVMVVELRPFETFEGVPENIKNLRKELIHAQFWYQTADAPFPRLAGDPSPKEAGGSVYWRERDKLLHAMDTRLREIQRMREMQTGQAHPPTAQTQPPRVWTKVKNVLQALVQPPTAERQPAREQVSEKAIQLDSKATIYAYAFSPDGKRAFTGANDNAIRLWDVETGRCLRVFGGEKHELENESI